MESPVHPRYSGFAALLLGALLVPRLAQSQIASESPNPHAIVHARAAAMGNAYAADPSDAGVLFWNPAALVAAPQLSVVATHAIELTYRNDRLNTTNLSLAYNFENGWAFGIGGTYHRPLSIDPANPEEWSQFSYNSLDLAVACQVIPTLSFGISTTMQLAEWQSAQSTAMAATVGAYYSPSPEISYALAYRGFGAMIDWPYDDPARGTTLSKSREPGSVVVALSAKFPARRKARILSVSMSGEKPLSMRGVVLSMGLEWLPIPFLALRGGYWRGPHSVSPKVGAGIVLGGFSLDYAYSSSKLEPLYHQASLRVAFD